MAELSPLAWALTEQVYPFIAHSMREHCVAADDVIGAETLMLNREVPRIAPLLVETPLPILANIWGLHPSEAELWRQGIAAALAEAQCPASTKETIRQAYQRIVRCR